MARWCLLAVPLILLLCIDSCCSYNVAVVGDVGTGKSRLVNSAMHHLGIAAHPAVAGNRLTKKAVTRKLHRYCAEGSERYYCWYDTPGMDICDCLSEASQRSTETEETEDQKELCPALETLNNIVTGSIKPGSTEVGKKSPSHSADVLLFASLRSGPQSAACGRRILQHLESNSISIPVVVALTGGHSSVGLSFGDMHVVTIHNLFESTTENSAAPLITLLSNFREHDNCQESDAHQTHLSSLAEKEEMLEESKRRLQKEITEWEDEKSKRQESYKQISTKNYELAEKILLAGVYAVGVAIAVRAVHFLFTTGVVVADNTQKWSKVAAIRLARLASRYIRLKLQDLLSILKHILRYLMNVLKQLASKIRNGSLFTLSTLKSVARESMRLLKELILYILGCVGSCLLFCLRLFPSLWKTVNEKVMAYRAEREARKLEERGIRDAKVCGSCMTHLGVQKMSVVSQTDDSTEVPVTRMESTASVSADDTTTSYPYEMKYRDNTMFCSSPSPEPEPEPVTVSSPSEPPVPNNTSRPRMNEAVQVIWLDGIIYPGVVSAIPSDDAVGVTWDDRSNGSYSVVPITRIIRYSYWDRFIKFVRPLYSWIFRWKFQFVSASQSAKDEPSRRSVTPPEWDFRKFDAASPGKGRRNSLPVIRNTEQELPDFKKESEARIENARSGRGQFMDPVGAPSGTTFSDVCFAADHLQTSLTKTLAASMERDEDVFEPESVPLYESVRRSLTPASPKQLPPTPATAERIILSPPPIGSDIVSSPRSPRVRLYDSRSPDVYKGKLLSPSPQIEASQFLQAKNTRRFIPPMRTSRQVPDKSTVGDLTSASRRSSTCSTQVIKSPKMSSVYDQLTDCVDDVISEKESIMTTASSRKLAPLGISRQDSRSTPRQRPQRDADPLTPIYSSLNVEGKDAGGDGLWGFMRGFFGSKSPPEREGTPIKRRTSFDTATLPRPPPTVTAEEFSDFNSRRKPSLMRTNSTASKADHWERYSSYISGGDQWHQPTPVVEPTDVDQEPEPGIPHAMSVSSTMSMSVESSEDTIQPGVVGWVTSLVRPPAHSIHRMLRKNQQSMLYEEFQKGRSADDSSLQQLPSTQSQPREQPRQSRRRSTTSTLQLPVSAPSAQTTTDLLGETLPDQSWKRFHQSPSVILNPALGSRKSSRQEFNLARRAMTPEI